MDSHASPASLLSVAAAPPPSSTPVELEAADTDALARVHEELTRLLEAVPRALHRLRRAAEPAAADDAGVVLGLALRQLQQVAGALRVAGFAQAACVPQAAAELLSKAVAQPGPPGATVVEAVEQGCAALLTYLRRWRAGQPLSPLALVPAWSVLQALSGAERVHPAELWPMPWRWLALPADERVPPLQPDAATRAAAEQLTLAVMRDPRGPAAAGLSDVFAALARGAADGRMATLWGLAAAVFEAQAKGLLTPEVHLKRMTARLLAQLRRGPLATPDAMVERLAHDLLFFCAQAGVQAHAGATPRLAVVRSVWGLQQHPAVDIEHALPAAPDAVLLAHTLRQLATAQPLWEEAAAGMPRPALAEVLTQLAQALRQLLPREERAVQALTEALRQAAAVGVPSPTLALEVAQALLGLQLLLQEHEFDAPGAQLQRLAQRIDHALAAMGTEAEIGLADEPLEPWLVALAQRGAQRQALQALGQSLRTAFNEAGLQLDALAQTPDAAVLQALAQRLQRLQNVMSVLSQPALAQSLQQLRQALPASAQPLDVAQAAQLAQRLAALDVACERLALGLSPTEAPPPRPRATAQAVMPPAPRAATAPVPPIPATLPPVAPAAAKEAPVPQQPPAVSGLAAMPELTETLPPPAEELPELVDVEAPVKPQPVPEEPVHLATLLRHAEEPGVPATPPQAPSLASGPSRAVALARLSGTAAAHHLEEGAAAAAPAVADTGPRAEAAVAPGRDAAAVPQAQGEPGPDAAAHAPGADDGDRAQAAVETALAAGLAVTEAAPEAEPEFDLDFGEEPAPAPDERPVQAPAAEPPGPAQEPPAEGDGLAFDLSFDLPPAAEPVRDEASLDRSAGRPEAPADEPLAPVPMLPGTAAPATPAPDGWEAPAAAAAEEEAVDFELHFEVDEAALPVPPGAEPPPDAMPAVPAAEAPPPMPAMDERVRAPLVDDHRLVGPLRVPQSLFDVYVDESEALSDRLGRKLAQWQPPQPLEREPVMVTHALAGMAATVGDQALSQLAQALEELMAPCQHEGYATPAMAALLAEGAQRMQVMLAQFVAGVLPTPVEPELLERLRALRGSAPPPQPGSEPDAAALGGAWGPPGVSALEASALEGLEPEADPAASPDAGAALPFGTGAELPAGDAEEAFDPALALGDGPAPASPPQAPPQAAGQTPAWPEEVPDLAALLDEEMALPVLTQPADVGQPASDPAPGTGAPGPVAAPAVVVTEAPAVEAGAEDDPGALDRTLFPIFEDEAQELLPQLAHALRAWAEEVEGDEHAAAGMRTLHTLKGGARLSGAMRLGDSAHALESAIEALLMRAQSPTRPEIEALLTRADTLSATFERLRAAAAPQAEAQEGAAAPAVEAAPAPAAEDMARPVQAALGPAVRDAAPAAVALSSPAAPAGRDEAPVAVVPPVPEPAPAAAGDDTAAGIDWSRFAMEPPPLPPAAVAASPAATVRVRAPALDRLVAQAGEVGISRARLAAEMQQLGTALADLDENLQRLRGQLREVELHADTELDARLEAARQAAQPFDTLEMERYTRLQELAHMMAESLDDVATVQHSLRQGLRGTEDELVALGRLAGELQEELLRTRLVAFDSLDERLQRVLRQAAQEAQRQVRLDIEGGEVEIDRGVLERMTPAFEHLIRNAVVHGIEPPAERFMAGKPAEGRVLLRLTQEGSQVSVSCSDDGRGLDLPRIHRRAVERGLLSMEAQPDAAVLQRLVFAPGFSTAEQLSPLAGRGVGLDVVRAEVEALGGHIGLETTPGQGSHFTLQLPLTTAVMQVLLLRCGEDTVAVPAALVEEVLRVPAAEAQEAAARGRLGVGGESAAFFQLEPLLLRPPAPESEGRMATVLLLRGAQQRLALQVQEVLGRQEAVLKPMGPQLATLPGLAGMSLLPSGVPLPVYNPAGLALRHTAAQQAAQVAAGRAALPASRQAMAAPAAAPGMPVRPGSSDFVPPPLVLVVDDSLTVRRVTQRLLEREGYRVAVAKDGLQALERLQQERPALVLTDLEMPRLDGFDLLRRLRAEPRWQALPVIVITSRLAARHRELAASLGVEHYLGKPYAQDELLALVARYSGRFRDKD